MTLNLTNLNEKHFNVSINLLNILQKIVAGETAVTKNPEFMPQNTEVSESSISFSSDKFNLKHLNLRTLLLFLLFILHITKESTAKFSLDKNQTTSSCKTQLSDRTPKIFVESFLHS